MAQKLRAVGVARMHDNEQAVLVCFDRKPTDDELRDVHDTLAGRIVAPSAGLSIRRWSMWSGIEGINPREDPNGAYVLYSDLNVAQSATGPCVCTRKIECMRANTCLDYMERNTVGPTAPKEPK
jgi:hypothetical protein